MLNSCYFERWNMSLRGWLLSVGAVLIVYLIFVVREFAQGRPGYAIGIAVFIFVLVKPQFLLTALPVFGLVFWATFKRSA
jgi:hypothetical protein